MTRTAALPILACALAALSACDRAAAPGAPASGGPATSGPTASQPWTTPSQEGLWRHAVHQNGQPVGSTLVCYVPSMGSLVPASGAQRDLRCDPAVRTAVRDGWTRTERCTTTRDDQGRTIRATVAGDVAAAFSVTTEMLDGDGAALAGAPVTTDTWLRMGPCPEGLGPGQSRADGTPLTPLVRVDAPAATTSRPRASRAPQSIDEALGAPGAEETPSEGLTPDAPPAAAPAPSPAPAPAAPPAAGHGVERR